MLISLNGGAHVGKPQKAIKLVLSIFNLEQETHNLTKKVTTFLVLYTVFTHFCNKREIVIFCNKVVQVHWGETAFSRWGSCQHIPPHPAQLSFRYDFL